MTRFTLRDEISILDEGGLTGVARRLEMPVERLRRFVLAKTHRPSGEVVGLIAREFSGCQASDGTAITRPWLIRQWLAERDATAGR